MPCITCHWWRPAPEAKTDDGGVPIFGRCIAQPPRPSVFAIKSVDDWNDQMMIVAWPHTFPSDHCAAHIGRHLVDQETGQFKRPVTPPGYDEGDETMQ